MTGARRATPRCLAAAVAAVTLTACSLTPDSSGAERAAADFHAALERADGQAACDLLAPATAEEVSAAEKKPCPEAILGVDVPTATTPLDVAAYVTSARVLLDADVVFAAEIEDRWLVVAAGCERQPDASYDCTVKGG